MQKFDVSKIYEKNVFFENESSNKYRTVSKKKSKIIFFICFTTFIISFIIMVLSNSEYSIDAVVNSFIRFDTSDNCGKIIWLIQMPMVVVTVLVGASLSLSGTVMQCILRNPLASPYTLGISSAASFGAAFAIIISDYGSIIPPNTILNKYIVIIFAFIFAMLSMGLIIMLVKMTNVSSEATILAGIAVSAMFSASLILMQYFADSKQLSAIISWSFGDLSKSNWMRSFLILIITSIISIFFYANRWNLNAMNAGDEIAKGLGVNTKKFRLSSLTIIAFLLAIIISEFGVIAFIGLVGPHISRMIVGSDHRHLIPASMAIGACLLLISNCIAYNIVKPAYLPVGLLTSFLGAPMFIYLLLRRYKNDVRGQ